MQQTIHSRQEIEKQIVPKVQIVKRALALFQATHSLLNEFLTVIGCAYISDQYHLDTLALSAREKRPCFLEVTFLRLVGPDYLWSVLPCVNGNNFLECAF